MKPEEFAQKIKAKYPQYKNVDDIELARSIVTKYPQYSSQVNFGFSDRAKQQGGILRETAGDIKETASGIKEDVGKRLEKGAEAFRAYGRGEQGLGRTLSQTAGQAGAGMIEDIAGQAVIGAGKVLLPQRTEEAISKTAGAVAEKVVGLEPVQGLIQRYQELQKTNPALARDIDSALQIGMLATDIATLGVGGRVTKTGSRAINKAIDIGEGATKSTLKGAGRIGAELEGALTGTSAETLQQAFNATYRGGKEAQQFTKALRGQITPENLVENVRDSIRTVSSANSNQYRQSLTPIVNEIVNTSGIKTRMVSKLNEFNIKVTPEGLDFSSSKFRTVPQAQTKISQAFNEVVGIGDEATLGSIDTTRQALRELKLVGDDSSARSANALIDEAISSVRDSGKQVKGYDKMLSDFAENAEFLDEISRSLSAGDKQTVDTAYRKLATSLKTNNERRMSLIQDLDKATGGFILSNITGQQLSEALPRGLFRQISAGLIGAGVVTSGVSSSMLMPLVFASPRVAGEVIRALGLGAQKTKIILDAIDSARKTVNNLNIPVPLVSPIMQTNEK